MYDAGYEIKSMERCIINAGVLSDFIVDIASRHHDTQLIPISNIPPLHLKSLYPLQVYEDGNEVNKWKIFG